MQAAQDTEGTRHEEAAAVEEVGAFEEDPRVEDVAAIENGALVEEVDAVEEEARVEKVANPQELQKDAKGRENDNMYVLRMPPHQAQALFSHTNHHKSFFSTLKRSLTSDAEVCVVEVGRGGRALGTARVRSITKVEGTKALTDSSAFNDVSEDHRKALREHLRSNKGLYVWQMENLVPFPVATRIPTGNRSKAFWLPKSSLQRCDSQLQALPAMSLDQTAAWFVSKLDSSDRAALENTAKLLDGITISVGSTCSGTDICVPVVQATLRHLSKLFQVRISVRHCFSVEKAEFKRQFIMRAHKVEGETFHVFDDVEIFETGRGFCHTCQSLHEVPSVDLLFCGSSCKDFSRMNTRRKDFTKCASAIHICPCQKSQEVADRKFF